MTASLLRVRLEINSALENEVTLAVRRLLATTFAVPVTQKGEVRLTDKPVIKGDISGAVGLVQDEFEGNMIISFPKATILSLMHRVYGQRFNELNKSVSDGVGEITNTLFAMVKKGLSERGYRFKMALPSVVIGDQHDITQLEGTETLAIPFSSPIGTFEVFVSLCKQD